MSSNTAKWLRWRFDVYSYSYDHWPEEPGVYVFARLDSKPHTTPRWKVLYVGQCRDFSDRLSDHERREEAKRQGMTHVHIRVVNSPSRRDRIECRIWAEFEPPMNKIAPEGCRDYLRMRQREGRLRRLMRRIRETLSG